MKQTKLISVLLLYVHFFSANAQSKAEEKYREQAQELRTQVWSWKKPEFGVKDVPAQYAGVSKVIMAQHTELNAASKSKLAYYGLLSFGTKKEQTITEINRAMIKLNDKKAVEDYSELSFKQFEKRSSFYRKDKTTMYVGVRIMKQNGTLKEINADDIVLTKDEKKEKEAKLAIPDLSPGDIIDFFVATEEIVTNDFSTRPYNLILFNDAPVLYNSFHGQLGKNYAVEYRSYNGAPDITVTKSDEDDIVIDMEQRNTPAFETSLWVAPVLQLPFVRMYITLGNNASKDHKPGKVDKNPDPEKVSKNFIKKLGWQNLYGNVNKAARKQYEETKEIARKKAKQMGLDYNELSDAERAALIYYTLRFTRIIDFDIDHLERTLNIGDYRFNNGLAVPLYLTLKAAYVDPVFFVSNERTGFRLNEVMQEEDIAATTYLPSVGKYMYMESAFDVPFETPENIEGVTDGQLCRFQNMNGFTTSLDDFNRYFILEKLPVVPASTPEKNAHIENLTLSLSDDKSAIKVKRSTTLRGHYKLSSQRELITYEDYYESERKAFNEEKSLVEELQDTRKGRKVVDEVNSAFAAERKKQKDAFEKEAKDWFEQEVTDLKDYKTDNLGVRHTAPDFVYSSTFNLGGVLKKAGNNIVVEIGKMQGEPLSVKGDQRKRKIDVYMPYARLIEYNIDFDIPEGYTAEGIAALNKKVETEAGAFITEASATDKKVTLKIKKVYAHGFEPAENWDKLLQFVDASVDFVNAKFLLKKK